MPKLTIDGQPVEVPKGTTILDAAERLGIHIPALCRVAGLAPLESCFVCVVHLASHRKLFPSCSMHAAEGMVVTTNSPEVLAARRGAVELLLSDHLGECLAPCELGCPARWDIPGFMAALRAGDLTAAAAIARDGLALPAVLGHICPAPCQKVCRRAPRDAAVAIADLHKALGAREEAAGERTGPDAGGRVAIVGAGPAGLAAAYRLRRAGHACTVFHAGDRPGGSLRAIDPAELPADVLAVEINRIAEMGVEFRPNRRLGEQLTLEALGAEFGAVLLAVGADPSPGAVAGAGVAIADGKVVADDRTRATSAGGVFAAGACAGRPGRAVAVVADGMAAAESIRQYLADPDAPVAGALRPINVRYGPLSEAEQDLLGARAVNDAPVPAEVTGEASAVGEAGRCLLCGCRDNTVCRLRQVATELGAKTTRFEGERRPWSWDDSHPEIVYQSHKCILCGACVRIAADSGSPGGLTYVGRGFAARVSAPYEGRLADALGPAAGACADACPTSAIRRKGEHERGT